MKYYNIETKEILESLNTTENGLNADEAKNRLLKNGPNKLKETKKKGILSKFISQFKDLMLIILIISAILSALVSVKTGESFTDTIVILFVVVLNAILGVIQESKAEKAIEALKDMSLPYKYAYSYVTSDNDFSTCDFDLKAIRDYDSSEDVILDLDNYYNNATINNEKLVVNGFTWYWTYYDKNYAKEYYYATEFDGRVFVYTYLVEDDATSKCDKYRLDILNSIYFNKKQQVA